MIIIEKSKLLEAQLLKKGVVVIGVSEKPDKFEVNHYQGSTIGAKENDYIVAVSPGKYFVIGAAEFESKYFMLKE